MTTPQNDRSNLERKVELYNVGVQLGMFGGN